MSHNEVVLINGKAYDRVTGMPVVVSHPERAASDHSAKVVHQTTAKSNTLSRRYVKKPDYLKTKAEAAVEVAATELPKITRFRTRPAPSTPRSSRIISDIKRPAHTVVAPKTVAQSQLIADTPAIVHPFVQRIEAVRAAEKTEYVSKPSDVLKKEAIETALASSETASGRKRRAKDHSDRDRKAKFSHRLSFAAGGLAILLVSAYFTYISMPTISVRVAAAQAGVRASYPAYQPSGYSLSGAVAYQPGSVSMNFTQNGGKEGFTLTQANSGWDSSALYQNYVAKESGGQYNISQDNGLTIYTYGNDAAWVSGGILYTIHGDATLSNEQVQHIATSL
jgi:hypothetical protein